MTRAETLAATVSEKIRPSSARIEHAEPRTEENRAKRTELWRPEQTVAVF